MRIPSIIHKQQCNTLLFQYTVLMNEILYHIIRLITWNIQQKRKNDLNVCRSAHVFQGASNMTEEIRRFDNHHHDDDDNNNYNYISPFVKPIKQREIYNSDSMTI